MSQKQGAFNRRHPSVLPRVLALLAPAILFVALSLEAKSPQAATQTSPKSPASKTAAAKPAQPKTTAPKKDCETTPFRENKRPVLENITDALTNPASKCRLGPSCGGSLISWSKFMMGADLADAEVKKALDSVSPEQRTTKAATVAVIDSGFDGKQTKRIKALSFSMENGTAGSGRADEDISGHGSKAACIIGCEETGITNQVNLKTYRVPLTKRNNQFSTTGEHLLEAARKACETSEVVNISYGTDANELDSSVKDLLSYAESKGCLVIHSAGNASLSGPETSGYGPGESKIFVEASNAFAGKALYSSGGNLRALGDGAFTFIPNQKPDQWQKTTCRVGDSEFEPVTGTSFTSPAAAGVAGQVISILKARGQYPSNPARRIALVKGILQASQKWSASLGDSPEINAYAAARLAQAVSEPNAPLSPDALHAFGLRITKDECSRPAPSCESTKSCLDVRSCIDEQRKQLTLCPNPNPQVAEELFKNFIALDEAELALRFARKLPENSPARKLGLNLLERLWANRNSSRFPGQITSERAFDFLLQAEQAGFGSFVTAQRLSSVTGNDRLLDAKTGTGTEDKKAELAHQRRIKVFTERFQDAFTAMDPEEQRKYLQPFVTGTARRSVTEIHFLTSLTSIQERVPESTRQLIERLPKAASR